MKYKFKLTAEIPLSLEGFDLATDATLDLGMVTVEPSGEMNDDQLAIAKTSIATSVSAALGVPTEVELLSIQI